MVDELAAIRRNVASQALVCDVASWWSLCAVMVWEMHHCDSCGWRLLIDLELQQRVYYKPKSFPPVQIYEKPHPCQLIGCANEEPRCRTHDSKLAGLTAAYFLLVICQ